MRVVLALLLVLMFAGCVEEDRVTYRISGAFTEDRANEDLTTLGEAARAVGAEIAILESFPEQFVITDLTVGACQHLTPRLDTWDFIATHTGCQEAPLGS